MPDSPSTTPTTPTNTVDRTEAETIQAKTAEQADLRVRFVRLLIAWHPKLIALDEYCATIEPTAKTVTECESFLRAPLRPPEAKAVDQARIDKALAAWHSFEPAPALPGMIKALPPEVSLAASTAFAVQVRSFYWQLFAEVFQGFLCGPVEMSMVRFTDDETRDKYHAALRYARDVRRLPASCPSVEAYTG
jgi:hypothetical protein